MWIGSFTKWGLILRYISFQTQLWFHYIHRFNNFSVSLLSSPEPQLLDFFSYVTLSYLRVPGGLTSLPQLITCIRDYGAIGPVLTADSVNLLSQQSRPWCELMRYAAHIYHIFLILYTPRSTMRSNIPQDNQAQLFCVAFIEISLISSEIQW